MNAESLPTSTTSPSPDSSVVRWSARVLVATFAVWVAVGSVTILTGWILPSDVDSTDSRVVVLGYYFVLVVCPTGIVGWKAIQLSLGRGRANTSTWTLSWLVFFALCFVLPMLKTIRGPG